MTKHRLRQKKGISKIISVFFFLLPYILVALGLFHFNNKKLEVASSRILIVDKESMKMLLIDYKGNIKDRFNVAGGKNFGTKREKGDNRTPEGIFSILSVENSAHWEYDFEGDGLGLIEGAYGPYFLRLSGEFEGIGIHGTHDNSSISTRSSHGCVRLSNDDLEKLVKQVQEGTTVIILPSDKDIHVNKDSFTDLVNNSKKETDKQ